MDKKSKLLLIIVVTLIFVSVSATFYQSVIQQDIELAGVGVEVGDDYLYTWFIHNQEEYEVEIPTTDFQDLLSEIENQVGIIDPELIAEIEAAYIESFDL